jgi:hypothetical protein
MVMRRKLAVVFRRHAAEILSLGLMPARGARAFSVKALIHTTPASSPNT